VFCAMLLLCAGCRDDGPTGPVTLRNYFFYGLDNLSDRRILRFDPSNGTLDTVSDSLPRSNGINISGDGRLLYVALGNSVMVFTSDSGLFVRTLPSHANEVASSPDSRLIAIQGWSHLGLTILAIPSYSVQYVNDSLYAMAGAFSHDGKTLYCIDFAHPRGAVVRVHMACAVSLESNEVPAMPGALIQAVPSVDEKLWFLYSRWDSFGCSFGVYDVDGDSLIYRTDFTPGGGWIVVSPDGRNVFFTNPGTLLIPPQPPPSAFYIYDIQTNTVKEVSTAGLAGDPERDNMPVGPMAITPDGKTLVLARAVSGDDLIVFDVHSQTITNYYYFNNQAFFYDITCQTGR
jgi:DNA-binding beta-propeller fold protein YncE